MGIGIELATYPGLDDRITILRAGDEVDAVFVRTARFNVFVDTLATPALCRQALVLLQEQMGDRPLLVINSHMDWDHFWGNAAVIGRPIIAHASGMARLADPFARTKLDEMRAADGRFGAVEIIPPTLTFPGESLILHGGDLTLEPIHTPGHTPDHVAIWIPELRVCLAVDAVEDPIPEVWSASPDDLSNLCRSLRRIRDLQPQKVIVAHGQADDAALVEQNLAYFARLQAAVEALPDDAMEPELLSERAGMMLEDFIPLPAAMPEGSRAFYRRCHQSNLAAALAARRAGVDYMAMR